MYLAVNLPRHITTLGGMLLLTASRMFRQILKCMGSLPLLNLNICFNMYLLEQKLVGHDHIILIVLTDNPRLGIVIFLFPQFSGDSNTQVGEIKGNKQYRKFS